MLPKPTRTPERIDHSQDAITHEAAVAIAKAHNGGCSCPCHAAMQSPAGEWRDVSTAPKDGTHFWAIEAEIDYHMEVWWAEEKGHAPGWMTHSDAPKCNGTDYAHFSHWLPLPPAPTGEG